MNKFKIKLPAFISNEDRGNLSFFINKIKYIPHLTLDEETRLFCLYQDGCNNSKDKLLKSHLKMVVNLAIKLIKNNRSSLSDLIQEGCLGLIDALKKFDPNKARFSTHSYTYAYNKILRKIMQDSSVVSIPESAGKRKAFFKLNQIKNSLGIFDKYLNNDDLNLIQEKLQINKADILFMDQRMNRGDKALNKKINSNNNNDGVDEFIDLIEDKNYDNFINIEDYFINKLEGEKINLDKIINLKNYIKYDLDKREREIINRRFLKDKKDKLSTIGKALGLSSERVRQLETQAFKKLRKKFDYNLKIAI